MTDTTTGGGATLPPGLSEEDAHAAEQALADGETRSLADLWDEGQQNEAAAALAAQRRVVLPGEVPARISASEGVTAEGGNTTSGEVTLVAPEEPDLAAAGVLATGETVTAEDLDGMPWYEVRVEAYVRNGPPGEEYGVGGDKIAHVRSVTQAPSFTAASPRLDQDLAGKWQHLLMVAPLADQAPTPDPEPIADRQPDPVTREWNAWTVVTLLLVIIGLVTLFTAGVLLITEAIT